MKFILFYSLINVYFNQNYLAFSAYEHIARFCVISGRKIHCHILKQHFKKDKKKKNHSQVVAKLMLK